MPTSPSEAIQDDPSADAWERLYRSYWRVLDEADRLAREQVGDMPAEWIQDTVTEVLDTVLSPQRDAWIAGYRRLMELEDAA